MDRRKSIQLTPEETRRVMEEGRTAMLATNGRDGYPHMIAMWYALKDGDLVMTTYGKSQKAVNIKRDPFETSVGSQQKTLFGMGGAIASPSTAYVYDWNMLPIGQQLWLMHLETFIKFPPLQDPASYNLDQVMQQVKNMKTAGRSD